MAKPLVVSDDEERRMTVIEHLEELRRVLIISLIAWGLATVIGFLISGWVLSVVLGPVHQVIGAGKRLWFTGPVSKFFLYLCVGMFRVFIVVSAIVVWQVW